MCGEQALFECPECYEHGAAELSAAAYCETCSRTVSHVVFYFLNIAIPRCL